MKTSRTLIMTEEQLTDYVKRLAAKVKSNSCSDEEYLEALEILEDFGDLLIDEEQT